MKRAMGIEYILRDLQRRLSNMIRRGCIHSVDFKKTPPRVRVEYSKGAVTAWLPFVSNRASSECSTWDPLSVGERVVIFSESGDLNCGMVISALNCSDNPAPSSDPYVHVTRYSDGTQIDYNRKSHKLNVSIGSGGDIEINAKTMIINANIEHHGNQKTDGNIKASGDVSDKIRSMSDDRDIFNEHQHKTVHGISDKPNKEQ